MLASAQTCSIGTPANIYTANQPIEPHHRHHHHRWSLGRAVLSRVDRKFAFVCFEPRLPRRRRVLSFIHFDFLHRLSMDLPSQDPPYLNSHQHLFHSAHLPPRLRLSATSSARQLVSLQHKHPPGPQPHLSHVPLLHTLIHISSTAPIVLVCCWSTAVVCCC